MPNRTKNQNTSCSAGSSAYAGLISPTAPPPGCFHGKEAAPKAPEALRHRAASLEAPKPWQLRVLASPEFRVPSPLVSSPGNFQSGTGLGRRYIANRGGFLGLGLPRRLVPYQPHPIIAISRIRPPRNSMPTNHGSSESVPHHHPRRTANFPVSLFYRLISLKCGFVLRLGFW